MKKSELYKKYADIAMANLYQIKPYQEKLETYDFEGNKIIIPLPNLKNMNEIGNYYYNFAKKAKRKAQNLHIQKQHLNSQLEFLENYKRDIIYIPSLRVTALTDSFAQHLGTMVNDKELLDASYKNKKDVKCHKFYNKNYNLNRYIYPD